MLKHAETEGKRYRIMLREREITREQVDSYLRKANTTAEKLLTKATLPESLPKHITFQTVEQWPQTPPPRQGQPEIGPSPPYPSNHTSPSWVTVPSRPASSDPSQWQTPNSLLSQRTSFSSINSQYLDISEDTTEKHISYDPVVLDPSQSDQWMDEFVTLDDNEDVEGEEMAGVCDAVTFIPIVNQMFTSEVTCDPSPSKQMLFSLISATPPNICGPPARHGAEVAVRAATSEPPGLPHLSGEVSDRLSGSAGDFDQEDKPEGLCQENEVSWFLSRCFNACILDGQNFQGWARSSLRDAMAGFKSMIENGNEQCLTALNLLVATLEAHGQRPLLETILSTALEVSLKLLSRESPIVATVAFMSDVVGRRARESGFGPDRLWEIYHGLKDMWGPESPAALTGLYHVAWRLTLNKCSCGEAWKVLQDLTADCERTLGPYHVQSITCMATSARVLYHLGRLPEAVQMIDGVIHRLNHKYEKFHPYRLEALARQAEMLHRLGETSNDGELFRRVEAILRDVIEQRIAILGPQNPRTLSTFNQLQRFLRERARDDEVNELPESFAGVSINQQFEACRAKAY